MSRRYTKQQRETAALICAIASSNGVDFEQSYSVVADALDIDSRMTGDGNHIDGGMDLAFHAWRHTQHAEHPDAEAEALIRTGWTP